MAFTDCHEVNTIIIYIYPQIVKRRAENARQRWKSMNGLRTCHHHQGVGLSTAYVSCQNYGFMTCARKESCA